MLIPRVVVSTALILASLTALALPASAARRRAAPAPVSGRASTVNMTCAQAKSAVDSSGAIVLGTGGQTYDRFVKFETYCPTGYYARPAWEPTRDKAQCYIGYYCDPSPPFLRP
jgi:hypothetical protein